MSINLTKTRNEYKETVSGGNTSEEIIFFNDVSIVSYTTKVLTATTYYLQAATNPREDFENGNTIDWILWNEGISISIDKQGFLISPTALRLVNTGSGLVRLSLRANR